jgi:hypothetical protein
LKLDRHSNKSGLTALTDLAGQPLKRYRDTPHYLSALDILREADTDDNALKNCSILAGLDSYRSLLDETRHLDYSAIIEAAVDILTGDVALKYSEHRLAISFPPFLPRLTAAGSFFFGKIQRSSLILLTVLCMKNNRAPMRATSELRSLSVLRTAALISLVAGAADSVGFMLRAGHQNPSRVLLILFAIWVLSPFVALAFAIIVPKTGRSLRGQRSIAWWSFSR